MNDAVKMKSVCILVFIALSTPLFAEPASPGSFSSFSLESGAIDGYLIWLPPDWTTETSYPVILNLHSAAEVGGGVEKAAEIGAPAVIKKLGEEGMEILGERFIVLSPHLEETEYSAAQWYIYPETLLKLILLAVEEYHADASRIYVMGYSTGGTGTWGMIAGYPGVFAAAVPMCGYTYSVRGIPEVVPDYLVCGKTPLWIFHNVWDQTVPARHAIKAVEALEAAFSDPFLKLRHPLTGSNSFTIKEDSASLAGVPRIFSTYTINFHHHGMAYYNRQIYDWMLSHSNPKAMENLLEALEK